MKFILKDEKSGIEMVLPVTPASFEIPHGIRVETVNLTAVGDTALAGFYKLDTIKLSDLLFPAKLYPFCESEARTDPYSYIRQLEAWCDAGTVVRFIISGTIANCTALIEDMTYGERDGSGDVYVSLSLHKYRVLTTVRTQGNQTGNAARTSEATASAAPAGPDSYTVARGDTLSAIARRFYGNAALYGKLAKYNGIKNANILSVGQVIKLPSKTALG